MAKTQRTGAASTMETSPRRKRAQAKKRRQEEAAWKAMNGPVEVRRIDTPKKGEMPGD